MKGGGVSFFALEHQKSSLPESILKVLQDPTGKLCCQMNLTINSTIIELSVNVCNFVQCIAERSLGLEFGQIDVKITTQNSHFSKFKYIHLPSCITSILIPLFT